MRSSSLRVTSALTLSLILGAGMTQAVTPGVDIAAPRVAISSVLDSLAFSPANPIVEQGDYVSWQDPTGTLCHTTTSGAACGSPSNLWNMPIGPPATCLNAMQTFTRQFLETPGTIPYFCSPHCAFGMRGQVTVTTLIVLDETLSGGVFTLSWSGGGGLYRVFSSDTALFTGTGTVTLTPVGGTNATSLTDPTSPALGSALFYLVMNQF